MTLEHDYLDGKIKVGEVLAAAQYIAHRYAHPVPPPAGERAELIADLRLNHEYCPKEVILEAADMLEADVSLINEGNKAQQVAAPMTEAQIFACDPVPHVMFDQQRIDFARAIEAFHGIGAKLVTKPDSRPQNCGTGHCSCIECPYPKTDWSAA